MGIRSSAVNILSVCKYLFLTMPDEKNNKLFYGVELETYIRHNGTDADYQKFLSDTEADFGDTVILKPDCGCEIVTVPATLRYHKEILWKKWFSKTAEKAYSGDGAGLHIHFSTNALTPLHLAKVMCFIHETKNEKFLSDIAGRPVNKAASWCRNKKLDKSLGVDGIMTQTSYSRDAISISGRNSGKSTELRIFRSNPTEQGVFQALEFIDALIAYLHRHGTLEDEVLHSSFVEWVTKLSQATEYPYLYSNLVRLGYAKKKNIFGMVTRKTLGTKLNVVA